MTKCKHLILSSVQFFGGLLQSGLGHLVEAGM
jgi:hypothetical protein